MGFTHDLEIDKQLALDGVIYHRVSCSCGFQGPWRKSRRTARRDGDNHEDRRTCEEA